MTIKDQVATQDKQPNNLMVNPREEMDLLQLAAKMWVNKTSIFGGMAICGILGTVYAFLAPPIYMSEAIIAPKATQKSGGTSALLSQFGDIGGMIGMQLGAGANSSLDRMEIIIKGREIAGTVIQSHNLLPVLFRSEWDSASGKWKTRKQEDIPTLRDGIELLRDELISVSVNPKNSTMNFGMYFRDPKLTRDLVNWYLTALNEKIRMDAKRDVETNMGYFEKQLSITSDPMLAEKIRQLMAVEIEKSMLLSSQSFDILEKPAIPLKKVKPNRKLILFLSLVLGFLISMFLILLKELRALHSISLAKSKIESGV